MIIFSVHSQSSFLLHHKHKKRLETCGALYKVSTRRPPLTPWLQTLIYKGNCSSEVMQRFLSTANHHKSGLKNSHIDSHIEEDDLGFRSFLKDTFNRRSEQDQWRDSFTSWARLALKEQCWNSPQNSHTWSESVIIFWEKVLMSWRKSKKIIENIYATKTNIGFWGFSCRNGYGW